MTNNTNEYNYSFFPWTISQCILWWVSKLASFSKESNHSGTVCQKLQLPHSYYFTTHILVLKFVNKQVFYKEIQDSHFPRKRGYFGTHLLECGEKGVNFDVQCFTGKMGVHLGWKVSVLPQKRGFILDWKVSVLSWKRGCFELKSQCFDPKKGVIFKLENKDGYHFFQWESEQGQKQLTMKL